MRLRHTGCGTRLAPLVVLALASEAVGTLSGCKIKEELGTPVEGQAIPTQNSAVGQLRRPTAAALSADGTTLYALAQDATAGTQGGYALYSGPVGGPTTQVATMPGLTYPVALAVSRTGTQLVIADLGDIGTGGAAGAIYRGTPSGTLSPLTTTGPAYPTALALSADGLDVYVTGTDPDPQNASPGVWRIPLSGGAPVTVYKGTPLVQPAGVTTASDGSLYVADTRAAPSGQGAVFRIVGDRIFQISKSGLRFNFPTGLAPAGRNTPDVLLATARSVGNEPWLYRLSPSGAQTAVTLPELPVPITEATSIQRAAAADVWIAVDAVVPASGATPDPQQLDDPAGQLVQLIP